MALRDVTPCADVSEELVAFTYSMEQSVLEKLTGSQLVNTFPAFYGTRRFITALTTARHLSLS